MKLLGSAVSVLVVLAFAFTDKGIISWEVTPPGQSGFIAPDGTKSPHYDDQLKMYETFGKKRMWLTEEDVEKNKTSEVVLKY